MKHKRRNILIVLAIALIMFGVIQLIPYRVTNSSVAHEPKWDSPRTRQLAVLACFNCHSNQTHTTWWEDVAPLSWWITNHVKEGRAKLNFSEWGTQHESDNSAEAVRNGSMPPSYYTWLGMHSDAKLTPKERQELATGLQKTLGG